MGYDERPQFPCCHFFSLLSPSHLPLSKSPFLLPQTVEPGILSLCHNALEEDAVVVSRCDLRPVLLTIIFAQPLPRQRQRRQFLCRFPSSYFSFSFSLLRSIIPPNLIVTVIVIFVVHTSMMQILEHGSICNQCLIASLFPSSVFLSLFFLFFSCSLPCSSFFLAFAGLHFTVVAGSSLRSRT